MTQKRKCCETQKDSSKMPGAALSMGLNNNLEFMGRQLHVQTENMAFPAAQIVTHVFCGGRVLLSRKSEYPSAIQESHDFSKIQQLMRAQHYQVIQEITDKKNKILASH
jgi:hypothetical protein